jgi:hypothetical protein
VCWHSSYSRAEGHTAGVWTLPLPAPEGGGPCARAADRCRLGIRLPTLRSAVTAAVELSTPRKYIVWRLLVPVTTKASEGRSWPLQIAAKTLSCEYEGACYSAVWPSKQIVQLLALVSSRDETTRRGKDGSALLQGEQQLRS